MGVAVDFPHEMEKLVVTNFSIFKLHLNAKGHAFGAFMLRLLKMHHIRINTRKLQIVLPGWFNVRNYPCYYISYTHNTCLKYIVMFFHVLDGTSIAMFWKLSL
jgi:hypothetical protein